MPPRHLLISLTLLVLLALPSAAVAQESPDDSSETDFREIDVESEGADFLRPICGDDVVTNYPDDEDLSVHCPDCPEGASARHGRLHLTDGYIGDFSGDGEREAILATAGCGGGFNFHESTVVMQEVDGAWEMLEYIDARNSGNCEHVDTSQRDWLLCGDTTVGQGHATTNVWLRYLDGDDLEAALVAELLNSEAACSFDGEFLRTIDEQVIEDVDNDGVVEILFAIRSDSGEPDGEIDDLREECERYNYEISSTYEWRAWKLRDDGPEEWEGFDPEDVGLENR